MATSLNFPEYLDRIEQDFSEPIDSYEIIDRGWTNLVIEINDLWIFRFVRDLRKDILMMLSIKFAFDSFFERPPKR